MPSGPGIVWNRVAAIGENPAVAIAARVRIARSRAVEYPRSSNPLGE